MERKMRSAVEWLGKVNGWIDFIQKLQGNKLLNMYGLGPEKARDKALFIDEENTFNWNKNALN